MNESEKKIAKIIPQTASGRNFEYVKELDSIWKFGGKMLSVTEALAADYSEWEDVTLPHTWNALDGEDGGNDYDRTIYWYHNQFAAEKKPGKKLYIEFLGANAKTTVYVNGKLAGEPHRGGYTAFRYDITELVTEGENVLDVSVDNRHDEAIAPISGDFNMYGGIYRRVYFITVDEVHIDLENNGSSGVFLTTGVMRSREVPADLGEVQVECAIINRSVVEKTIEVAVCVLGDHAPEVTEEWITLPAKSKTNYVRKIKVVNPTLWQGVCQGKKSDGSEAGYQYTFSVELRENGKKIDQVEERFGFRYFWIDPKEGFFLNGKSHPLRGVNRHSCRAGIGSALTEELHAEDMEFIRELGANTVRLCHYPHTDYFYDLCDDNGLVVWTEIPTVNMIGTAPDFEEVTRQQLRELICQQYNRPSIVFWGLENEFGNGTPLAPATAHPQVAKAKALLYRLDALAKELDPTGRYTTQAVNREYAMNRNNPELVNQEFETNEGWKSDIIAWNIYPGWYPDENFYGSFAEVVARKSALDSRPFAISEYGWGANPHQHELYPELGKNQLTAGGPWHPEEYQNLQSEEAVAYISQHKELWATYCWVLFDFAVDARNEGGKIAINDKGLVTADRRIKKDIFYLYKANWNREQPFVYITSRRFMKRRAGATYVKVYSNCETVEMYVNGKSLGRMEAKGNGIFIKNVVFSAGETVVTAEGITAGKGSMDSCTWVVQE